jgi:CRP/FNR family transcriptional activator FtrB
MRIEDLPALRALDLFAGMAEQPFEALLRPAFLQRFPAQVDLVAEGERPDFMHVVVEGLVELRAGTNGRETTLALLRPLSTFVLAAVLTDKPYLMAARTLAPSRLLLVPAELVRETMAADAAFAQAIVRHLAGAFRTAIKDLKGQKLRGAAERLANWLLREAAAAGGETVELDIEKRTLAALLGMTPENLSRAFATLGAYGVEVRGGVIRLRDPADLRAFAKPTPLIDDPHA